jgi:hypothetical protein
LIHFVDHGDGENIRIGQGRARTQAHFRRGTGIELRKVPDRLIGLKFESSCGRVGCFEIQSGLGSESDRYVGRGLCAEITQRDHGIGRPADERRRVVAGDGYGKICRRRKGEEGGRGRLCQIGNRELRWLESKSGAGRRYRYGAGRGHGGKNDASIFLRHFLAIQCACQLQSYSGEWTQVTAGNAHGQFPNSSGRDNVRCGGKPEAPE